MGCQLGQNISFPFHHSSADFQSIEKHQKLNISGRCSQSSQEESYSIWHSLKCSLRCIIVIFNPKKRVQCCKEEHPDIIENKEFANVVECCIDQLNQLTKAIHDSENEKYLDELKEHDNRR